MKVYQNYISDVNKHASLSNELCFRNFVKSHGLTLEKFVKKQGLDKTFFECERRMWRLGSRELPRGIQYDGGSDWVGLHIDFVRYLIHEVNTDPLLKGM